MNRFIIENRTKLDDDEAIIFVMTTLNHMKKNPEKLPIMLGWKESGINVSVLKNKKSLRIVVWEAYNAETDNV